MRKKIFLLLFCLFCHVGQIFAQTKLAIVPLSNRPASEIQALIAPFLESTDRVIADGSNLIIKTTPQRLAEIKQLVAQLDTSIHNLLITVMQGRNISARELNADAQVRLHIPLENPQQGQGVVKGRFRQNRIRAHNNSTQKIRTLEGRPAYVKVGKTQAVQYRRANQPGYGYPVISSSTELIEATTGFAVTPRLAGDHVIIEISPWSEQINRNGHIDTRSAQTTLRTKLGEWVEIGGTNENQQFNEDGVLSTVRRSRDDYTRVLIKVDKE